MRPSAQLEFFQGHFEVAPIAQGEEGAIFDLESDYDANQFRLIGKVADEGPYSGVLVHRGWQTSSIELPQAHRPNDGRHIFAQAEVELS